MVLRQPCIGPCARKARLQIERNGQARLHGTRRRSRLQPRHPGARGFPEEEGGMSFHPTTQRLILRAPTMTDMAAFVAILNDYEVSKNLQRVPHPFTDALFFEALERA